MYTECEERLADWLVVADPVTWGSATGQGRQRNQGHAAAERQRGDETRSSITLVDQNSGATTVVSLSDVMASSGALAFRDELVDPGEFIPEHTPARKRGRRKGEYVIVHGEANRGKRRFGDALSG